ncbi:uncharacterized protein LOC119102381 [Pollicipes pollicipes]|uniref:uncharacterized protein LOC119102381 n=1 Tax=Pollicipes pollicipes TaxID=41117 RepID=UPI0018856E00|nr:uncharacterized protein LOC119102381 [Pollicipes pollicipes]
MSLSSKPSSSVEDDLRAMVDCDESVDDDRTLGPKKDEILKRAQDWQSVPPELVRTFTKGRKSARCQRRVPNVWSFPKAECLRHQTDSATCRCGVGKGFTFFLENLDNKEFASNIDPVNFYADPKKPRNPAKNIATLIPAELHVKKYQHTGGLELIQDDYTVTAEDHAVHQTSVPSRTPVTREEVLRLKDVFRRLLLEAGMGEHLSQTVLEKRTDSEVEKLVELVRAEQDVYNIVFHEIIRQVTVDCTERGEILSELRDFYARLLNRIPQIVMSMHDENIIQRSLDRRLMEELLHFKIRLVQVVLGLDNVHHIYEKTKGRMCTAQEELKHALIEAQKTSVISDQLHVLYKMQKERQEREAASYEMQRDFWKNASCAIISKVVNVYKLGLFRFLATALDTWAQLGHKIMEGRETKDNEQLEVNFSFLKDWSGKVDDIMAFMNIREQRVYNFADSMWHSMDEVANQLKAEVNPDPAEFLVTPFEGGKAVTLHKALVQWSSKFTVDLGQVDDTVAGGPKIEKYLARLESVRESWRFHTECHILLAIRDDNFQTKVGANFRELLAMMKAAHPLLDGAFYAGIDPAINKTELGVRMWAKRNIRVGDLSRLQTDLATWSMSLQRSCDANGYMLWQNSNTTYNVVREKLTQQVDQYRGSVIQCLTDSVHERKLELALIRDLVTQWTVECLTLAAPYHPTVPEEARRLIEQTVSDVRALGVRQQEISSRLRTATDHMERSWEMVQQQGGCAYDSAGIDADTLADMFRAECDTWCQLSDTCMQKLKSGEMFESDVTTRDVDVQTETSAVDRATITEPLSESVSCDWSWLSVGEGVEYPSGSSLAIRDESSCDAMAPAPSPAADSASGRIPRLSLDTSCVTGFTAAPPAARRRRSSFAAARGRKASLATPSSSKRLSLESAVDGSRAPVGGASARRPSVGSTSGRSRAKLAQSSSKRLSPRSSTSRRSQARLAASSSKRLSPRSSTSERSQARLAASSSKRLSPRSSTSERSEARIAASSSKRLSPRSSTSERSEARIAASSSKRLSPRSSTSRRSQARPRRRSTAGGSSQGRLSPGSATTFSGQLFKVTFPDFMIEMFAREMRESNTGEMVVATDEERERMTALQLHIEQVAELQQRLGKQQCHVQNLQAHLAGAKDEIQQLTHQLNAASIKLRNANVKLQLLENRSPPRSSSSHERAVICDIEVALTRLKEQGPTHSAG